MWYRLIRLLLQNVIPTVFRVRVFGQENVPKRGGVLIASNHQSYLDPVLIGIGVHRPVTYMARAALFRIPIFGKLIYSLNAFPIKRARLDPGGMREAERRLKDGWQLLLFPEGTRTRDGSIGRVRPGFGLLAMRADVPVVPVAIHGAFEAWPRGRLIPRPARVSVAFGRAISPEEVRSLGPRALAEKVGSDMRELMSNLRRGAAPGCSAGTRVQKEGRRRAAS